MRNRFTLMDFAMNYAWVIALVIIFAVVLIGLDLGGIRTALLK